MRRSARRTGCIVVGGGRPAARCIAAIEAQYRRTVAGARTSAIASTKAATVSGVAGSVSLPCPTHHAEKTRESALSARSVFGAKAPAAARACSSNRSTIAAGREAGAGTAGSRDGSSTELTRRSWVGSYRW